MKMKKLASIILSASVVFSTLITSFTGVYAAEPRLYGDLNNDKEISMTDVIILQQAIAELITLDEVTKAVADVKGNDGINMADVTTIQQYVAEIIKEFPAGVYYTGNADTDTDTDNTDTDIHVEPYYDTIFFTNKYGWENVYAYAFNTVTGEEMASGSGLLMEYTGKNESGEDMYCVIIDKANYNSVSFSNGAGEGTELAPVTMSENAYYINDNGFLASYYYDNTQVDTDSEPFYKEIFFINDLGWETVYVYITNNKTNASESEFPGTEMSFYGKNNYGQTLLSAVVDTGSGYNTISFNNGTADSSISCKLVENNCYYFDSEANKLCSEMYNVNPPVDDTETDTTTDTETDSEESDTDSTYESNPITIYFADSRNWSYVYVHVYNSNTGTSPSPWPGELMAFYGEDELGRNVYIAEIDAGLYNMISFSSGTEADAEVTNNVQISLEANGYYTAEDGKEVLTYTFTGLPQDDTEIDAPEYTTYYFTKPAEWETVCLYTWNSVSGEKNAEWPGTEMSYFTDNDKGEKIYSFSIDTNKFDKMMFNDSSMDGSKTEELSTSSENNAFYVDSETGAVKSYNYSSQDSDSPLVPDEMVVFFANNKGWSEVYVYTWNSETDESSCEMPGMMMNYYGKNDKGEDVYSAVIDITNYDSIIFNNGTGNEQSEERLIDTENNAYYLDGLKAISYYYDGNVVSDTDETDSEPVTTDTDVTPDVKTLYFINTFGWTDVYVYAWGSNKENAEMPGVKMTLVGTNENEEEIYSAEIDFNLYTSVIFSGISDGQSVQTSDADLSDLGTDCNGFSVLDIGANSYIVLPETYTP